MGNDGDNITEERIFMYGDEGDDVVVGGDFLAA
jgi:hypothetical protein